MTARAADPYRPTIYACYVGYVCQAIINNFAPLLFLTFGTQFGLTLERLTVLTSVIASVMAARQVYKVSPIEALAPGSAAVAALPRE